jgi:uncharacterized protein (DUF1330 family)
MTIEKNVKNGEKKMAAYLIARINVTDQEKYKNYVALSPAAIAAYGGRFLVRGGETKTLEGAVETNRIVVVEFDRMEKVTEFYNSELYQKAKLERIGAAEGQFVAVQGV